MIREILRTPANGIPLLVVFPLAVIGSFALTVRLFQSGQIVLGIAAALVTLTLIVLHFGFFMVAPNQGQVMQLFGAYVGTAREAGLRWANPFYMKHRVSLRVRNFETGKLKVNDIRGNPIEIATVVVWRVVDTAEAVFKVDDYENFVHVQSEAALRSLASGYAYDSYHDEERCLVGHTAEVSEKLKTEIQERLAEAGVEVLEARISHLAYSSEIAAAMLQRQQASAVVAARQKIVEGAVGMVETALDMLAEKRVVELDDERRAAMVSNLLVVLCSDRHTQPVVNTGSLYH
ncbi:MAG TPA: SPFH domain-containing protein [Thermoanaerobaculia bacterium]|nr:SPFH domain-containing protein [Thermoanaerobaculia bacterium]